MSCGKVNIQLDRVDMDPVDTYLAGALAKHKEICDLLVWSRGGLEETTHTLTITAPTVKGQLVNVKKFMHDASSPFYMSL